MSSTSKGSSKRKPISSLDLPDLPEYLQPQLRLFLTADIVGSTGYKQNVGRWGRTEDPPTENSARRKKNLHPKWFAPIADFYSHAQKTLGDEWEKIRELVHTVYSEELGDPPTFWKAIGDEIGFSKRLNSGICVLACMRAWVSTLQQIRRMLKSHNVDLDVKSAAWIAGFPVLNTEIIFSNKPAPRGNTDDDYVLNVLTLLEKYYSAKAKDGIALTRDFVGPSIDTGFRIASKSSPRKMTISVDLAYMCASVLTDKFAHDKSDPIHSHLKSIHFGYDGRESLKGVMGGKPYPIFWVDLDISDAKKIELNKTEDTLLGRSKGIGLEEILKFSKEFIGLNPDYLCEPYILGAKGKSVFGQRPAHHIEQAKKLREITDWFEHETKKMKEEDKIGDPSILTEGKDLEANTSIKIA